MDYLIPVTGPSDIHPTFRGTAIADLLAYHNFDRTHELYSTAPLVIGMCMDHRERLRIPKNFAYILRSPGANFRSSDFICRMPLRWAAYRPLPSSDIRNAAW
jgi:carbonic anhydrase